MTYSPRLIAALAFAATFAAGATAMRATEAWKRRAVVSASPGGWTEVANQLGLTTQQRAEVDRVFARYQPSTDSILLSLAPRLAAVTDSMHRDIEAALTPEQRARLKGMQRTPSYLLRRKSLAGSRVDTLRISK